ncbi:SET domain-containing protein-lysine N-methyltransferase [Parasphingorhabdus sp. JC815]|uniref:SET domain-containing protein-lysine N-methyltransferase n=1 Tax=Parasphingorhabdus sp. JC815 TaxID=3232140 RepID=UPI00345955D2
MIASSDHPKPAQTSGDPLTLCYIDERKGLGVRTLVDTEANEIIHHFSGEIRTEIEQHSLQISHDSHICGTEYIGFLLHSCAPNCRLDMTGFSLITMRDISANEVLTVDYAATEDYLFRQFACHCGASDCRNWITGRRETISPDGKSYLETLKRGPVISCTAPPAM